MKNTNQFVLYGATLLDGTEHMVPQKNRAVYIKDGRIERITDAVTPESGYTVVDLTGKYLMPGLFNMHVHLAGSGKPQEKQRDNEKLAKTIKRSDTFCRLSDGLRLCP